jgi:hypothetical protein
MCSIITATSTRRLCSAKSSYWRAGLGPRVVGGSHGPDQVRRRPARLVGLGQRRGADGTAMMDHPLASGRHRWMQTPSKPAPARKKAFCKAHHVTYISVPVQARSPFVGASPTSLTRLTQERERYKMGVKAKVMMAACFLLLVDLAANAVNSVGFSWMYTIPPTDIWDFPVTPFEVVVSLAVGYGWNVVIIVWFLFFRSSPLAAGYSRNNLALIFGLLLIGFCLGDWVSNFWAILKIPSIVTVYWIGLTLAINWAKSFILAYYYGLYASAHPAQ